ncbi:hypothetical protein TYRP_021379 [Tyrophagus putrescentiae]|nr:hypothetical protein TYRP_021379 [Tyrophagus putrescentiae]
MCSLFAVGSGHSMVFRPQRFTEHMLVLASAIAVIGSELLGLAISIINRIRSGRRASVWPGPSFSIYHHQLHTTNLGKRRKLKGKGERP